MKYRGDIDGLRAVAVLAVMFFHAGFGMPGGYIGVDVFFVISGYLITSIIIKDLDRGEFSLTHFWDRRIRRIWPAGIMICVAVLIAASVVMLPASLELTAKDALAQILMLANFRFWLAVDYFAGAAELRPLLHTWSLAVEEQFYIFYPPLLILLQRFFPGRRAAFLVAIAVASLGLSYWALERIPDANFYLLPFRAWELLLGGILASRGGRFELPRIQMEAAAWVGLALIALPVFLYDERTPFPGLAALPPCLGSALIVATPGTRLSTLLGTRPLRVVGQMSYSLYLWHWPILAFLRYALGAELAPELGALALALSFGLSWLSYRWVETPFRKARARSFAITFAIGTGSSAAVAAISLWIVSAAGLPSRFPAELVEFSEPDPVPDAWVADLPPFLHGPRDLAGVDLFPSMGSERVEGERPDFLLWGDSHAMAISGLVDDRARALGLRGHAALRSGTRPLPGVHRPAAPRGRELWNAAVLEWVERERPRVILLCARWSLDVEGRPDGAMDTLIAPLERGHATRSGAIDAMRSSIAGILEVAEAASSRVVFLLEVPFQGRGPESIAISSHLSGEALPELGAPPEEHEGRRRSVVRALPEPLPARLEVVDLGEAIAGLDGRARIRAGSMSFFWDDDHLSPAGAETLLTGIVDAALGQPAPPIEAEP